MQRAMQRTHPALPFLAAACGIATFSVMDAAMKGASLAVGVYAALLWRNLIGAAIMLPVWRLGGGGWPAWPTLRVHLTRSAVATGMASLFFWGLVRTPMAEAIALSFIAPLIALYLARVVLGEDVGKRAVGASLLALAGVLIIALAPRPANEVHAEWDGIAAILASAVLYAWNLILQRQQAQAANPREIAFFQNALVALFLAVAAPWLGGAPVFEAAWQIVAAAFLAVASLLLTSWAYARAEAQALVVTEYTAFIWAALLGWLVFGEAVGLATVAGAALIVVACLISTSARTEQTAL
jgi:S-adenosylmethionine uptake transporter